MNRLVFTNIVLALILLVVFYIFLSMGDKFWSTFCAISFFIPFYASYLAWEDK